MLNFFRKLVIKQWIDYLYITGMVTAEERIEMTKLMKYVGSVGRKFRPLLK